MDSPTLGNGMTLSARAGTPRMFHVEQAEIYKLRLYFATVNKFFLRARSAQCLMHGKQIKAEMKISNAIHNALKRSLCECHCVRFFQIDLSCFF